MIRFFNPGLTYAKYKEDFLFVINKVLSEGQLILRADVEQFEKTMADYLGVKYFVALNSGTDALYLALRALKIGPGDEVLVPSRTFVATAQVVKQVGAEPVFYDTDGMIDMPLNRIKAVIPVHIEGEIDHHFDKMLSFAEEKNIYVIEDSAQALGATHNGKKAGTLGIAGCFSFYPAKILGAFGDAGGLATNDEEMYRYVHDARNHFKDDARDWGINSRLDNLQAAVLNVRVKHLPEMLSRRQDIAEMYQVNLVGIGGLSLPPHTEGRVWQDYIVRTKERDALYQFLKDSGIETLKNNYPFPIPKRPLAQEYEDETLRLPCNENLTNEEVLEVITKIKQFYA